MGTHQDIMNFFKEEGQTPDDRFNRPLNYRRANYTCSVKKLTNFIEAVNNSKNFDTYPIFATNSP